MDRDQITVAIDETLAERTALQDRIEQLDRRRDLLGQVLGTFDAPPPLLAQAFEAAAPVVEPAVTSIDEERRRRERGKKRRQRSAGQQDLPHQCPLCPARFSRPNGLARHLGQTHGTNLRAATKPPAPAPEPSPAADELPPKWTPPKPIAPAARQVPGKVFACSECDATFGDVGKLTGHTIGTHKRRPSTGERTPTVA